MSSVKSELLDYGLVLPDYKNSNLSEIKRFSLGKRIHESNKKLLIIIDGLGLDMLRRILNKSNSLTKAMEVSEIKEVTTLSPSVTPTLLTSFDSGLDVAKHGVIGDTMPVKELGMILKLSANAPAAVSGSKLDDSSLSFIFPEPNLINKIAENNKMIILKPEKLKDSSYCKSMYKNKIEMSYTNIKDLFVKTVMIMKKNQYDFIYIYMDEVDELLHACSPDSKEAERFVYTLLSAISKHLFAVARKAGYSILITSDHGLITIKAKDIISIENSDNIMKFMTMPPWGSHRYQFMDVVDGIDELFERAFNVKYRKNAILLRSDDAIMTGLFGSRTVEKGVRYRFGKYIAIALGNHFFYYLYPHKKKWWLDAKWHHAGVHGGMLPKEMYVPAIII